MKKLIFLLLIPTGMFAQTISAGGGQFTGPTLQMSTVYSKTTYTNSLTETTAYFNIEPAKELAVIFFSSDSATADVYFDTRNGSYINGNVGSATYADSAKLADSVVGGANSGEIRNVLLKTTTLNRLLGPSNTQMRIRVAYRSATNGTTAGRVFRVILVKQN